MDNTGIAAFNQKENRLYGRKLKHKTPDSIDKYNRCKKRSKTKIVFSKGRIF